MQGKKFDELSDADLLSRYQQTLDNKWLGCLLQRYTLLLFGTCMKYLKNESAAQDAVQQIFLKVITVLPHQQVQFFKSWLYIVAKNHCLLCLRGSQMLHVSSIETIDQMDDNTFDLNKHLLNEQTLSALESSLIDLKEDQRNCVTLFYLENKSYVEISELLSIDMLKVKSYIQNGKRNLKILVEKKLKESL